MDSLFTKTTVELTKDFTNSCSSTELESKLSQVKSSTGVNYSKADDTFLLSGSWSQVNQAFKILTDWLNNDNNVSTSDATKDEFRYSGKYNSGVSEVEDETGNDVRKYDRIRATLNDKRYGHVDCGHTSELTGDQRKQNIRNIKTQGRKYRNDVSSRQTGHNQSLTKENIPKRAHSSNAVKLKTGLLETENKPQNNSENRLELKDKTNNRTKRITNIGIDLPNNAKGNQQIDNDKPRIVEQNLVEDNVEESDVSSKKNKRKPGEKGYWSRAKIENYNDQHTCDTCGVTLKSRKRYMEHVRRVHLKEIQCKVCLRGFGYPTDLKRHKCVGHPDPTNSCKPKGGRPKKEKSYEPPVKLPCEECDFVGKSKKKLSDHIKRSHRLTVSCDMCDKLFGLVCDLSRHKAKVHSDVFYFCDRCSKRYKSKDLFMSHLKTHEEGFDHKEKYPCEVCGKLFGSKYILNAHCKKEHLGIIREYLCQICGKKFRQRNSYNQHMNVHNGVKPFVCDVCGKAFTYNKSLKEHKYMHDTIKRFKCKLCDKSFRQRTTLLIHSKVHKTIKDHICSHCGKGFTQKQALDRHERVHTGLKPYTCVPCQRKFGDASTIRRHMKAIHLKTDSNWREEITCSLKRKSDYYILGGTGQNRTYKSKARNDYNTVSTVYKVQAVNVMNVETNKPTIHDTVTSQSNSLNNAPILEHDAAFQQKSSNCSLKQAAVTRFLLKSDDKNEVNGESAENRPVYTTYTELNNIETDIQTSANLQSLSLTNPYSISTAQLSQNISTINRAYNQGSVGALDYFPVPQPVNEHPVATTSTQGNQQQAIGIQSLRYLLQHL